MDPYKFIKDLNNPLSNQPKGILDIVSKIPIMHNPSWIKAVQAISSSFDSSQFLEAQKNISVFSKQFSNAFQSSGYLEFQKNYAAFNSTELEKLGKIFSHLQGLKFHDFDFEDIYGDKEIESSIIIDQSNQVKQIITEVYKDYSFIYKLEPRKFEEVIAELLFKKGFEVELTKQTRDNGYDIIALQNMAGFPVKFLVECKRYSLNRPVGIEIIRSFRDVIAEENANKGIIVTSSYFTKPVIQRKQKLGNIIDLADKDEILQWIFEYVTKS